MCPKCAQLSRKVGVGAGKAGKPFRLFDPIEEPESFALFVYLADVKTDYATLPKMPICTMALWRSQVRSLSGTRGYKLVEPRVVTKSISIDWKRFKNSRPGSLEKFFEERQKMQSDSLEVGL